MRSEADLHDYQRIAVDFLWDHKKSALFADVGLGKAIMSLTVLDRVLRDLDSGQALVVAPIRVAKQTWPTEIAEWEHVKWLPHVLVRAEDTDPDIQEVFDRYRKRFLVAATALGIDPRIRSKLATNFALPYRDKAKKDKRVALARAREPLHIIGKPQVEWLVQHHGKRWPYKTTIIDESSAFKDYSTNAWKAMNSVYNHIDRMHILTASPAAETWLDIWAQIRLLDRGERLGNRITHYRDDHFTYDEYERRYDLREGHAEMISEKIADICLVMKAEDYLPLEKPNMLNRYIELAPDTVALYERFVETFVLNLPDTEIEALNGGALINKLLQFTGGAVYDEDKNLHEVHQEKIEDLRELIDELQGEPLMVAYWYQSSLKRLKKAFPHATVMDKAGKAVDAWNAGKIPLLFIHPASAGHGLNMQKGPGHDLAFFDLCWSRELYEQIIGRLARQGQKKVVRVWHLIVRRHPDPKWSQRQREDAMTADELVMQALADKGEGQARLFRLIRQIRDRVLDKRKPESEDDDL